MTILKRQMKRQSGASGAVSYSFEFERQVVLREVRFHLDSAGATAENLTVTINDNDGSLFDSVLITQDMNGVADVARDYEGGFTLREGDTLDIAYTNTDDNGWSVTIGYEQN